MYEAEDTHWWYRGLRGVMSTLLGLGKASRKDFPILDAGCGTGGTLSSLAKRGFSNLEGFDLSPIAIEFCHKRGMERVRLGSITQIPFEDRSFDLVISCDVVSDAGTDNELDALQELYRVLKPGGRLFLNLPAFEFLRSEHDRAVATTRRVTRADINRKLELVGFRIKRSTYWNSLLLPVVVAVRLLKREKDEDLEKIARSDIEVPWWPANLFLSACVGLEHLLLRWVSLPVGSSVAIVAVRPR
ncbi:MAG: class I SAM-dependent methyltransferase [Chloroflexia bacterium]